jgi:hypothetical protein
MMLGQAMQYAVPLYGSKVKMKISLSNVMLTWAAFVLHLVYILAATWWHEKMGGAGRYGAGAHGMDEDEEEGQHHM